MNKSPRLKKRERKYLITKMFNKRFKKGLKDYKNNKYQLILEA